MLTLKKKKMTVCLPRSSGSEGKGGEGKGVGSRKTLKGAFPPGPHGTTPTELPLAESSPTEADGLSPSGPTSAEGRPLQALEFAAPLQGEPLWAGTVSGAPRALPTPGHSLHPATRLKHRLVPPQLNWCVYPLSPHPTASPVYSESRWPGSHVMRSDE